MPMVRVRIAVAVDQHGHYNGVGWSGAAQVKASTGCTPENWATDEQENLCGAVVVRYVEANVEVPSPDGDVVEGQVTE